MRLEFSQQIFEKYSNIIFNENELNGSPAVPCGQTDMMQPIVTIRSLVNACNNNTKKRRSVMLHLSKTVVKGCPGGIRGFNRQGLRDQIRHKNGHSVRRSVNFIDVT
jgi:hypothetical protein